MPATKNCIQQTDQNTPLHIYLPQHATIKKQSMENYGTTGEILRSQIILQNLNKELKEWKTVADKYRESEPFAANVFVGEALRNTITTETTNNENQIPHNQNNQLQSTQRVHTKPKSIEVIRRPLKVTKRVYPGNKTHPELDNDKSNKSKSKSKTKEEINKQEGNVKDNDKTDDGDTMDKKDKKKLKKKKKGGVCILL